MSIKIGNFDIAEESVENRVRIMVLEQALQKIARSGSVDQSDIDRFRSQAISTMQKEYPELGIEEA